MFSEWLQQWPKMALLHCKLPEELGTVYFCSPADIRMKGQPRHATRIQENVCESRQCVSGSELQSVADTAMKEGSCEGESLVAVEKPGCSKWRNVGHLLRKAAGTEYRWPKREARCATNGRATEARASKVCWKPNDSTVYLRCQAWC